MSTGEIVTRFAPSPTGRLHLGHAWSALQAHDFAKERGGRFLLRIEDIDPGRTRAEFVAGIEEDLRWLGLDWDGPVARQSERLPLYAESLDRLKGMGLVYPCFCTRADIAREIAASAAAPHGPEGPLYPGICKALSPAARAQRCAAEPHAWRLDVDAALTRAETLAWIDYDHGPVPARPQLLGDVVLARKDAPVSYHLAVTLDDAAQGVTHIVRGEDLYLSTHVHRLVQALLDLPRPAYRHHKLLTDSEGRRLAKRTGAPAIADLRAGGADPEALVRGLREGRLPLGFGVAGA